MHMIPVTDPEELAAISAWADEQKVDGLVPGWTTWKFVDDSGKFYGFYQQGARLCSHFHVDHNGDGARSLRALRKVEDLQEMLGVRPLILVPPSGALFPVLKKRHVILDFVPVVRQEGSVKNG